MPPGVALARTLNNLGVLLQGTGDLAQAMALSSEALALERAAGNHDNAARSLGNLAMVAARQGRHDDARTALREVLAIHAELGSLRSIAYTFESLAFVEWETGALARAVRLWAAAATLREAVGEALPTRERVDFDASVAAARSAMADEAAFTSAWRQGAAMSRADAVAYASRPCDDETGRAFDHAETGTVQT